VEGSGHGLTFKASSQYLSGEFEENNEKPVRIAGLQAET
jgi:hypothetical protein